jgi:hypothetical protein
MSKESIELVDYLDRIVIKKKPPPQDNKDNSKNATARNEKIECSKVDLYSNDYLGQ